MTVAEVQKDKLEIVRQVLRDAGIQYIVKENNGSVARINVWIGE